MVDNLDYRFRQKGAKGTQNERRERGRSRHQSF